MEKKFTYRLDLEGKEINEAIRVQGKISSALSKIPEEITSQEAFDYLLSDAHETKQIDDLIIAVKSFDNIGKLFSKNGCVISPGEKGPIVIFTNLS